MVCSISGSFIRVLYLKVHEIIKKSRQSSKSMRNVINPFQFITPGNRFSDILGKGKKGTLLFVCLLLACFKITIITKFSAQKFKLNTQAKVKKKKFHLISCI